MKIYRALTRALCPKNLQLNVSLQFLLDIKDIFINLLALQEQTNYNMKKYIHLLKVKMLPKCYPRRL